MNRRRATLGFIFSGGLLIFLSPYLIHDALIKHLPWIHKKSGRLDSWNLPFASAIYREPTSASDKVEDSFGGVP
jgi:hypothetical protein